jgi:hypothetical protein
LLRSKRRRRTQQDDALARQAALVHEATAQVARRRDEGVDLLHRGAHRRLPRRHKVQPVRDVARLLRLDA